MGKPCEQQSCGGQRGASPKVHEVEALHGGGQLPLVQPLLHLHAQRVAVAAHVLRNPVGGAGGGTRGKGGGGGGRGGSARTE